MQNQRFNEDQVELEAHLAERIQAYVELGETPEQALVSAREKFGETEVVLKELRLQRNRRHPVAIGALAGLCWLAVAAVLHLLTGWLVTPIVHERTPFPFGGSEVLLLLTRVYVTLVPAAVLVMYKGVERFPKHPPTLLLGVLSFSFLHSPSADLLSWLLVGVPTLHGALIGWRMACHARRERQRQ
ncbi:permease prefix domain 1-containing protein [Armatimonas rosea]|uniref:Uncharacterized protein n=1 Tax=Armatimonas rosea TaxID=685828 RepID=A0A7W9SMK3_ARMRO|nr:permease prefix domain 1-containing protein [Armatimonas rosea]MBB6049406.1 hypothetical protein [Armatimonas rosea]